MKKEEHSFNIKFLSILAYIGPLFFIGKFSYEKTNKDVKFHCKQGERLLIAMISLYVLAWIITMILSETLSTVVTVTQILMMLIITALWITMAILGIINANKNKRTPLPIIGGIANSI